MIRKSNQVRRRNNRLMFLLIGWFLWSTQVVLAQEWPFYSEIAAFKKQDSLVMPPANALLFIGSSSFTRWKDVQAYFPNISIVNRGFGGSSLPHLITYAPDIIFPYKPAGIVIYCGENDLASDPPTNAKTVFKRFKHLYMLIRKELGSIPVGFVSIKPSPSRRHLKPQVLDANKRIEKFLHKRNNARFINVYDAMLNADGGIQTEIFTSDSLHMNAKGYAIWQKIMEPVLTDMQDGKLEVN